MTTPLELLLRETEPMLLLRIMYYANSIRALQGLAPRTTLRLPTYTLTAAHRVQCPFWLTCTDDENPTHDDINKLCLYLQDFGIIAVTPSWLSQWTRRHDTLWHNQLREAQHEPY